MTIKHLIKILEDLKEKYGNMPVERLMQIQSIPFYVKFKSKKEEVKKC